MEINTSSLFGLICTPRPRPGLFYVPSGQNLEQLNQRQRHPEYEGGANDSQDSHHHGLQQTNRHAENIVHFLLVKMDRALQGIG